MAIENLGGEVRYKVATAPRRPEWLTSVFGEDFFESVYCVDFSHSNKPFTQAELEHVKVFRQLRRLVLYDSRNSDSVITNLHEALPRCEIEYIY